MAERNEKLHSKLRAIFDDPTCADWSNVKVAKVVGCSEITVRRARERYDHPQKGHVIGLDGVSHKEVIHATEIHRKPARKRLGEPPCKGTTPPGHCDVVWLTEAAK
jgi:hypothetical protein